MKSETKTCSRCKQSLPLSAFGTHKKRSGNDKVYDFRRSVCKPCHSAYETERSGLLRQQEIQSRPNRHCHVCGSVLPKRNTKKIYCSQKCASKAARPGRQEETKQCEVCSKSFTTKHPTKKYCSAVCYLKSYAPVAAVKNCEYCGKETTRPRYCSPDCWKMARRERQRIRETARQQRVQSLPRDFTLKDWQAALAYFDHKCAYCRKPASKLEQDHFVPVKHGGGYTRDNIVPACPSCNSKKRAKNPIDWLASQVTGLIAYARVMHYFNSVKQG